MILQELQILSFPSRTANLYVAANTHQQPIIDHSHKCDNVMKMNITMHGDLAVFSTPAAAPPGPSLGSLDLHRLAELSGRAK